MNGQTDRLEHMESDTDEQIYIKEECWGTLGKRVRELRTTTTTATDAFQKQPEQSFLTPERLDVHSHQNLTDMASGPCLMKFVLKFKTNKK